MPIYWRGSDYGKSPFALRLLILGESHNDETPHSDAESTCRVVRNRIDHLYHGSFFQVVETILIGRKPSVHEVSKIWESSAFANYAPHVVVRPNAVGATHFDGARERFADMVGELEPDLVCFFSKKAWENRPRVRESGRDKSSWNAAFGLHPMELSEDATVYPYRDRKCLAVRFNHPRGLGAPAEEWHREFAKRMIEATAIKYGLDR